MEDLEFILENIKVIIALILIAKLFIFIYFFGTLAYIRKNTEKTYLELEKLNKKFDNEKENML